MPSERSRLISPAGRVSARSATRARTRCRRLAVAAVITLAIVLLALVARSLLVTNPHGAQVLRYTIDSRLTHSSLPQVAVVPPGHALRRRTLLVFLHGKGSDGEDSNLNDEMYSALARLGSRAPDVVFPDGGEDSYWHDRSSGEWGRYVIDEVIPEAIRRLHADPRRVAIGGISMGGFGAYDIARLDPTRFCAVGGHSAALWASGGETAPGAFDDAEDFARHDVIAAAQRTNPYAGKPLWLDVGSEDPFRAVDTRLAHELQSKGDAVQLHVWPGGHEGSYWRSHWGAYLRFYASALARC
jgi:S-formylglutathione hydrolase FrmB